MSGTICELILASNSYRFLSPHKDSHFFNLSPLSSLHKSVNHLLLSFFCLREPLSHASVNTQHPKPAQNPDSQSSVQLLHGLSSSYFLFLFLSAVESCNRNREDWKRLCTRMRMPSASVRVLRLHIWTWVSHWLIWVGRNRQWLCIEDVLLWMVLDSRTPEVMSLPESQPYSIWVDCTSTTESSRRR